MVLAGVHMVNGLLFLRKLSEEGRKLNEDKIGKKNNKYIAYCGNDSNIMSEYS